MPLVFLRRAWRNIRVLSVGVDIGLVLLQGGTLLVTLIWCLKLGHIGLVLLQVGTILVTVIWCLKLGHPWVHVMALHGWRGVGWKSLGHSVEQGLCWERLSHWRMHTHVIWVGHKVGIMCGCGWRWRGFVGSVLGVCFLPHGFEVTSDVLDQIFQLLIHGLHLLLQLLHLQPLGFSLLLEGGVFLFQFYLPGTLVAASRIET